jgi:squalene-hopene/tetraprenyl-beta-curcumene cyclase
VRLALINVLLTVSLAVPAAGEDPAASFPARKLAPPTSDEPKASSLSMRRSADYLDATALQWTRERKCGSCHTNYAYMMSRPALKEFASPALGEVRAFFEKRVAHWDDAKPGSKPKWDAEVISTADALAINDAVTTGTLHPLTRRALDRVWTLQKANGGFEWLKCRWPPLEHDDYYGAIVAARGAGYAPEGYAKGPSARVGLDRLRGYFRKNPPPDLHHQTMLLWASTRIDGIMTSEQKEQTLQALRSLQKSDGGWCLPSLGHWKRRDGTPNDLKSPSDGYATGLVVFVLREAGVPATDPAIQRAIAWLKTNQRVTGRWFTRSLNDDEDHYIADAGTGFAVLALRCCEPAAKAPATAAMIRSGEHSGSLGP